MTWVPSIAGEQVVATRQGSGARGLLTRVVFLTVALMPIGLVARGSGQPTADFGLSAKMQSLASGALAKAVERDPLMGGPGAVVSGLERAVLVRLGTRTAWFTPVLVRYRGVINHYCRLAVWIQDSPEPNFVPVPANALRDSCNGIAGQWIVDASGVGTRDVIQAIQIRSGRGLIVVEPLVYLADEQTNAGYCLSTQASREISVESLRTAAAIAAALRIGRARLGVQRFACDS